MTSPLPLRRSPASLCPAPAPALRALRALRALPALSGLLALSALAACTVSTSSTSGAGPGGAGGAGGSSAGGAGGAGGAGPVCFSPTPLAGEGSFLASDGDNTGTFSFTLPNDPEGGVVALELTGAQLFATVTVVDGGEGAVLLGLSSADDGVITASFVGAPGITYEIAFEETSVAATPDTQEVTATWSLASVVDCHEPNDTPAEASPITLGEPVEAYLFEGYTTNEWPTYEAHHDWFSVDVAEAGTLSLSLTPPLAADASETTPALSLQLLDASDVALVDELALTEPFATTVEVEPGSYRVLVMPFASPPFDSSSTPGANWTKPYVLSLSVP
jgi:hypothetical protein